MRRGVVLVASLVVVLAAAFLVPLPLVESAPGGATAVEPLLEVEAGTTPIHGRLELLTVRIRQPSLVEAVRAAVSDARDLRPREAVIPPTLDRDTYFLLQEEEFRRTFQVAVAVGLRAAGYPVGIRTAPQVVGVLEGGPADGILQVGDIIRTFDGHEVRTAEEVASLARRSSVGDELDLTVERAGEVVDVTVTAGRLPGLDQAGVGITLQTLEEDIELPVEVELTDQQGIGGPSAGLMIALTVYDLLVEADLARGRHLVGTGTVDGAGVVGRVGSIREKTLAAIAAGADLMLVPASQEAEARAAADGGVEVVGVETVREAIEILQRG